MYLSDLNSKPHGGKSLRDLVGTTICTCFYPTSGLAHHKLLRLDQFHNYTHCQITLDSKTIKNQYNT